MSIKGPDNVSGNGNGGGTEGLSEEQKKKLAEDQAKAEAAQRDADIQGGLNGNRSAAGGSGGAGGAGGAGAQIFGDGTQGAGGFGYGGVFQNTTLNVDQQQLNDLTNRFFNYTMSVGSLPFGIGTQAMQNSLGNWFQAIMNCFQFNTTTTNVSVGGNFTLGGGQTVAGGGETRLIDKSKAPEGYTATSNAGVFSKDGKFYKYEENSYKLVESKEDGSAIESVKTNDEVVDETKTKTKTETGTNNKTKTEADYAKEGGYTKTSTGYYKGKDGKYYKYENGTFTHYADMLYSNGQYIVNGTVYNKDGSKSPVTVWTRKGTPTNYTEEHYRAEGGYQVSQFGGRNVYEKGKDTLYFDATGKCTQFNTEKDGCPVVWRMQYDDTTSTLKSQECYNGRTGVTTRYEYMPVEGQTAGVVSDEAGQPHNVDSWDRNGRISTNKVVTHTRVEIKIEGNTAIKVTTTYDEKVR